MNDTATTFVILGGAFLVGLAADAIGRRSQLPRVTMVLVIGFAVGPDGFGFLPESHHEMFHRASSIALTMVGFLLGERLVHSVRGGRGRAIIIVSIAVVAVTAATVFFGLWIIGVPFTAALLLAGIATATDPAATVDVIRQTGAKGKLSDLIQGVVAVDDALGLLVFSLLTATAIVIFGGAGPVQNPVAEGLWEIGGALLVGGILGLLMALVTGRVSKGEPTLLEGLGFVFLSCGLAIGAGVSFILAAMVMGVTVAMFARHHERPFHTIEGIELPFMILFFMLAGASLDIRALQSIGWIGIAYVVLRIAGRVLGGWWGGKMARENTSIQRRVGLGLMPQAGVALGMALLAKQKFPESGELILQVAIGSTVVFELIGPLMTRFVVAEGTDAKPGN